MQRQKVCRAMHQPATPADILQYEAALATNAVVNAVGGAVLVTNGTGQVVGGSNLTLDVQTNTVSQKGLVELKDLLWKTIND